MGSREYAGLVEAGIFAFHNRKTECKYFNVREDIACDGSFAACKLKGCSHASSKAQVQDHLVSRLGW